MNLLKITLILTLAIQFHLLPAQKPQIVTVDGEAQVEFPDFKSRLEVEQEAFDKAKVNALEQAFGTAIIQGNSTYMKNLQTNKKVETSTVFNMIANTYVKGEVLEVLKKEFKEIEGEMEIGGKKKTVKELRCTVRIKARELTENTATCDTYLLDCPDKRCQKTDFHNDDPLYLFFSSPSDGYVSVFLDDGNVAQCLLPYTRLPKTYQNGVPVSAFKEYIFFSPEENLTYFESKVYTDSYVLYTDQLHEQNRIFILFSPTPIEAPALKAGLNMEILSDFEKEKGYQVPRALESEKFQDWLIKSRLRKDDLGVKTIDITISK
ncbi:MAG: hypothetical protein D4R67_10850 [Bacteroidetes bacterium]|nr:MAG: hypothetical protein D4R67_10850 [Bacteroidota bacterium]